MLAEFVITSFAAFMGWQIFRNFLPFIPVSSRTAPILAFGIAYGLTYLSRPSYLIAIAATGGVALLNKVTDAPVPSPAKLHILRPKLKLRKSERGRASHRIPSL